VNVLARIGKAKRKEPVAEAFSYWLDPENRGYGVLGPDSSDCHGHPEHAQAGLIVK
jgi:hypothetical protein